MMEAKSKLDDQFDFFKNVSFYFVQIFKKEMFINLNSYL